MSNLNYQHRIVNPKLPSLEFRRMRGDQIEVFKILRGYYDPVTTSSLFSRSDSDKTRGHKFKLTKFHTNSKRFRYFFTNRVITNWNSLTEDVVSASSLNMFKNKIDKVHRKDMYSTNL